MKAPCFFALLSALQYGLAISQLVAEDQAALDFMVENQWINSAVLCVTPTAEQWAGGGASTLVDLCVEQKYPCVLDVPGTHIAALYFVNNTHVTGGFPAQFSKLSQLKVLSLPKNSLNLALPTPFFSSLASLEWLDLSFNTFTGPLPTMAAPANSTLIHLSLNNNEFTGEIPPNLVRSPALQSLDLSYNQLDGQLDVDFALLTNLTSCRITHTQVTGSVPASLVNATMLLELDLSSNALYGSLPDHLPPSLTQLSLAHNKFDSLVPASYGSSHPSLLSLDLSHNLLKGPIPYTLVYLPLKPDGGLKIQGNPGFCPLASNLPPALKSKLDSAQADDCGLQPVDVNAVCLKLSCEQCLQHKDCHVCQATKEVQGGLAPTLFCRAVSEGLCPGGAPAIKDVGECKNGGVVVPPSQLDTVDLQVMNDMKEHGWLPIDYLCNDDDQCTTDENKQFITALKLPNKNLATSIPPSLARLTQLRVLIMSNNKLTGPLPPALCSPTALLATLKLDNNLLEGRLPTSFVQCPLLEELDLQFNKLSGELPSFASMPNVVTIALNDNQFKGTLPDFCSASFHSLVTLTLQENEFEGGLPFSLPNCDKLQTVMLDNNKLSGALPSETAYWTPLAATLQSLSLRHNKFTGAIPAGLGSLEYLITLDLSENKFKGQIPPTFSSLKLLSALILDENLLTGKVPAEFGQLTNLQYLDLYSNFLSGPLPAELASLVGLRRFRAGANKLDGPFPAWVSSWIEVKEINLDSNNLNGNIPEEPFAKLLKLEELELAHNNFTLPLPASLLLLPSLTLLELAGNDLCPYYQIPQKLAAIIVDYDRFPACDACAPLPNAGSLSTCDVAVVPTDPADIVCMIHEFSCSSCLEAGCTYCDTSDEYTPFDFCLSNTSTFECRGLQVGNGHEGVCRPHDGSRKVSTANAPSFSIACLVFLALFALHSM